MKKELTINNFRAWNMEEDSEYFFLCEGEYGSLQASKDDIDDLIELLYRVKGNYSQTLKSKNNTCNKLEEDACGLAVRETLSSPVSYNIKESSK